VPVGTGVADERIVQPVGGKWPHAGGGFVDAERDAMFKMRHLHKMTGDEIARHVGVTRQCVDQEIGGAKIMKQKTPQWPPALKWKPSPSLLAECGFTPASPSLQVVSGSMRSKALQSA
jgi:DNA-binding XRE family transcriptional regulator